METVVSFFSVRKFKFFNLNNIVYYPLTFLSPVFSFYENMLAFVYQKFTILGISAFQGSELVK